LAELPRFNYGGQAVIEGVMIRGRSHFSLAVRRQDGTIYRQQELLNNMFTGPARRIPLLRGILVLLESLSLGVKALRRSANIAMQEEDGDEQEELPAWAMAGTLAVSMLLGVGLFFLLPLLIVWLLDPYIASDLVSNVIEGVIRLTILVSYIKLIGLSSDIKRVFAYHGAEHMAVHTYEAGLALVVENVRKFGTPHPRCGTAFLLTVVLISIVVFAFLQRPPMEWRIISRIALVPVIAAFSYEVIRFSGAHQEAWFGRMLSQPGLILQRLTTRQPDDSQIEVAICAMETAIAADQGRENPEPISLVNGGETAIEIAELGTTAENEAESSADG
jgi:uncharacterized protein YqhQ